MTDPLDPELYPTELYLSPEKDEPFEKGPFLPLQVPQKLLRSIYEGLVPGGLLFLSEKVKSPYPQFQETITLHYEFFKAHNGYAQTEIERKKEALKNVLVPLTEAEQTQMLNESGFSQIDLPIKPHNFMKKNSEHRSHNERMNWSTTLVTHLGLKTSPLAPRNQSRGYLYPAPTDSNKAPSLQGWSIQQFSNSVF